MLAISEEMIMLKSVLLNWVLPMALVTTIAVIVFCVTRLVQVLKVLVQVWKAKIFKKSPEAEKSTEVEKSAEVDVNKDFDKGLHQAQLQEALTTIRERQGAVSNFSNAYVQETITRTIQTLSSEPTHVDVLFQAKKDAVVSVLNVMFLTSASSNEFPGQRGLGLEQVMKFCEQYLAAGALDNRELNFTQIFRSFSSFNS